jgi:molybdopterin synthase catalytic subunit
MLEIVEAPIDPRALERAVAGDACGAVVTFVGAVRRDAADGRAVTGMWYEAYAPMALALFQEIAREARARFGAGRIAIVHRIGELAVGEASVAVAAAAAHRSAAFAACEYCIDQLKRRAPIWKRERYADGASRWRENA